MRKRRPALFLEGHFAGEIIILCVRWYPRSTLGYRDLEETTAERNRSMDHTTVWRWAQRCAPELNWQVRRELKKAGRS
jgi:transposase-like protein